MGWWTRLRSRDDASDGAADLTKAVNTPTAGQGGVLSVTDSATIIRAAVEAARPNAGGRATPLPRDPADLGPFGPGHPLFPAPIDPTRPDTNRPEPRINEYPVSANLPGTSERLIPWKVLRDAADAIGLFRRCIEVRKAHVEGIDWDITISRDAVSMALRNSPGASKVDIEQQLRERFEPEIGRLRAFWQTPDRGNDLTFADWVKELLEEHFVLDAVTVYPRRTFAGQVWSLEILDGSTIKPLLTARGGRPLPPHPAFQQILHGFPRGEFIASTVLDGDHVTIPNAYPADQLLYFRRNVRSWTPYGKSAVEQALYDGEVWLRRLQWIKSEYTEGALPPARLKNTTADPDYWTPTQIDVYEQALNDMLKGNTAQRRSLKLNPPGWETDGTPHDSADRYKPDYDLFLIKLVSGHFETVAQELGFSETGGLGSAGFHEGQADVQERKGTHPTLVWLQSRLTDMTRRVLGGPAELEFRFLEENAEDDDAEDEVWDRRVRGGRATLNEDRDRTGKPRYDFPDADKPMLMSERGVFPLEGAADRAVANADAEQQIAQASARTAAAGPPKPAASKPAAGSVSKADELDQLRRFLTKNRERPFTAAALTKADVTAAGLPADRVVFKADDAGGRDDDPLAGVHPLRQSDGDRSIVVYRPGV